MANLVNQGQFVVSIVTATKFNFLKIYKTIKTCTKHSYVILETKNTNTKMRCSYITNNRRGIKCKRNACDESDFCKQHNPLNKLDDITCAICLDDIKDPVQTGWCTHLFCRDCIAESVVNTNTKCPCCRQPISVDTIGMCIRLKHRKDLADKFVLDMDIIMYPNKWGNVNRWTKAMKKMFDTVYPQ